MQQDSLSAREEASFLKSGFFGENALNPSATNSLINSVQSVLLRPTKCFLWQRVDNQNVCFKAKTFVLLTGVPKATLIPSDRGEAKFQVLYRVLF